MVIMCAVLNVGVFLCLPIFALTCQLFYLSTAEAVLQKMDDMEKMRRRRMMEDLGVFHDAEVDINLFYCSCISNVFHRGKLFHFSSNSAKITSSKAYYLVLLSVI